MDFELPEELKMLKEMAYKFAVAEILPVSQECDEHEKYTPEIRKKGAETGLVGAWLPNSMVGPVRGFSATPSSPKNSPKWIWGSA